MWMGFSSLFFVECLIYFVNVNDCFSTNLYFLFRIHVSLSYKLFNVHFFFVVRINYICSKKFVIKKPCLNCFGQNQCYVVRFAEYFYQAITFLEVEIVSGILNDLLMYYNVTVASVDWNFCYDCVLPVTFWKDVCVNMNDNRLDM